MKDFDEEAFVISLSRRDEDAKRFKDMFKPNWLKKKELVPVLGAIYDFTSQFDVAPSLTALHDFMKDMDKDKYEARWKTTLTSLEMRNIDTSEQVYALDKAKNAAVVNSLDALTHSQTFQQQIADGEGASLMSDVSRWLSTFDHSNGEGYLNIKDAFEKLLNDAGWQGRTQKIPSGISCFDEWTDGGLRQKQMGIIMAPTGNGKSAVLMNIAHNVSMVDQLPVLFVTNELTLNEQSERFLVRMAAMIKDDRGSEFRPTIQQVQHDPSIAYSKLDRKWHAGLHERLWLSSIDLDTSCNDLEAELNRLRATYGFKPSVLVLDFMERMSPNNRRVSRDKEWIWIGEIAKDLVRLAKRQNLMIWTAVQTNRGGLNAANGLNMGQGQGSIRQFQEATTVIGARKVYVQMDQSGETQIECMAFKELKQRHAQMSDREVNLRVDLSRMYITKDEIEAPQDMIVDAEDKEEADTQQKPPPVKGQREVKGKKW